MLLIKCIVRPDMAVLASFRCSAIVSRPLNRDPPRYGYSHLRRGLFIGLGKPPRLMTREQLDSSQQSKKSSTPHPAP